MTWWLTDNTHDPLRQSWVESANGHSDFPIQNLPFGIFAPRDGEKRAGVAIGDSILDLRGCADAGLLNEAAVAHVRGPYLNGLMGLPAEARLALRRSISDWLSNAEYREWIEPHLFDSADAELHMPMHIGDYTDFYVGIHHAHNVGKLFRPDNPLLPNYKYVPIGYHGRASSVRVSGEPLVRPKGQSKAPDAAAPVFAPSGRLDYELELGVWIGQGSTLGDPVTIEAAPRHISGYCLLNDWSARDFQAWEYQPLGPFLAKNFHSTISPWVVTQEAMAPFRTAQPRRPKGDPEPLPYLFARSDQDYGAFTITLEVALSTAKMRHEGLPPFRLSKSHATDMYWTVNQIVAHHASNGCNLNAGDLLGTGTISSQEKAGFGSLLELTAGGREPLALPNGELRTFLEDGDEVILSAFAQADGFISIGMGECRATVLPAR